MTVQQASPSQVTNWNTLSPITILDSPVDNATIKEVVNVDEKVVKPIKVIKEKAMITPAKPPVGNIMNFFKKN